MTTTTKHYIDRMSGDVVPATAITHWLRFWDYQLGHDAMSFGQHDFEALIAGNKVAVFKVEPGVLPPHGYDTPAVFESTGAGAGERFWFILDVEVDGEPE